MSFILQPWQLLLAIPLGRKILRELTTIDFTILPSVPQYSAGRRCRTTVAAAAKS